MRRELDTRTNAEGDRITLAWYPNADRIEIEVVEGDTGRFRRAAVPRSRALDAYQHPYLYLDAPHAPELLAA